MPKQKRTCHKRSLQPECQHSCSLYVGCLTFKLFLQVLNYPSCFNATSVADIFIIGTIKTTDSLFWSCGSGFSSLRLPQSTFPFYLLSDLITLPLILPSACSGICVKPKMVYGVQQRRAFKMSSRFLCALLPYLEAEFFSRVESQMPIELFSINI